MTVRIKTPVTTTVLFIGGLPYTIMRCARFCKSYLTESLRTLCATVIFPLWMRKISSERLRHLSKLIQMIGGESHRLLPGLGRAKIDH